MFGEAFNLCWAFKTSDAAAEVHKKIDDHTIKDGSPHSWGGVLWPDPASVPKTDTDPPMTRRR